MVGVFCTKCGKKIIHENDYCANCGTKKFDLNDTFHKKSTKHNASTGKIIGLSVLAIIVIGMAYVWTTEIQPVYQSQRGYDSFNPAEHWGYECTTYSTAEHDCFGVPYGP